jgi:ribosome-associated protein
MSEGRDTQEQGATEGVSEDRALRVSRSLSVPMSELTWRFSRSSGSGGQHANKVSTRAEVLFDVEASRSLGPRQRARILEKLGPEVRVVADDTRSQARNRAVALERLADTLATALKTTVPRIATAPSASSKRRRIETKRRRGDLKRQRSQGRHSGDD